MLTSFIPTGNWKKPVWPMLVNGGLKDDTSNTLGCLNEILDNYVKRRGLDRHFRLRLLIWTWSGVVF